MITALPDHKERAIKYIMTTTKNRLASVPPDELTSQLLTNLITIRTSDRPDTLFIEQELQKAFNLILNGFHYYIVSYEGSNNSGLISKIYSALKKIKNYQTGYPISSFVINFNAKIYVFLLKKPVASSSTSRNTLSNTKLQFTEELLGFKYKPYLCLNDKKMLLTALKTHNFVQQCLAHNILIYHNIFHLPTNKLEPAESFAYNEYGIQAFVLACELSHELADKNKCIVDISTKTWLIPKLLNGFFEEKYKIHHQDLNKLSKSDVFISIGLPNYANIYQFLILIAENLSSYGQLQITTDLISPFKNEKEQKCNFLLHKLHNILPLLGDNEIINTEKNINGNDLLIYDKFRFNILTAFILAENSSVFEAELLLKNILNFCKLFLENRMLPSTLLHFRIALNKLDELLIDLDNTNNIKTSAHNFINIAETLGFNLKKHHRIYPTHGNSKYDAGKHFFLLEKK